MSSTIGRWVAQRDKEYIYGHAGHKRCADSKCTDCYVRCSRVSDLLPAMSQKTAKLILSVIKRAAITFGLSVAYIGPILLGVLLHAGPNKWIPLIIIYAVTIVVGGVFMLCHLSDVASGKKVYNERNR